jgi:hypothetical protein
MDKVVSGAIRGLLINTPERQEMLAEVQQRAARWGNLIEGGFFWSHGNTRNGGNGFFVTCFIKERGLMFLFRPAHQKSYEAVRTSSLLDQPEEALEAVLGAIQDAPPWSVE